MSTDIVPANEGAFCRDVFTDQQCVSLLVLRIVFGVLGIIASLFLIFVMWVSNKLNRIFYRILLYIAICSAVRNTVRTITIDGLASGHPWCTIQGIILQFNVWATISWELCLTIHLFLNSINIETIKYRERIYHLACWGTSFIFTIIPLSAGKYGPAITWCWIEDSAWRIGVLYAEYFVIILVVFLLYGKVIYGICTVHPTTFPVAPDEARRLEIYKRQVRPMIAYPFIVLMEGILPISFRIHNLIYPNVDPSFSFTVVFYISVVVWGLPFVVVYVLDPVTRGEVLSLRVNSLKKLDTFRKRRSQVEQPNNDHKGHPRDHIKTISIISIEPSTIASPIDNTTYVSEDLV